MLEVDQKVKTHLSGHCNALIHPVLSYTFLFHSAKQVLVLALSMYCITFLNCVLLLSYSSKRNYLCCSILSGEGFVLC